MFSRVAVLPQPPLLVPELMGASTSGSEPMRAACLAATARLNAVSREWVVVTTGDGAGSYPTSSRGSFGAFGVDRTVSLGGSDGSDSAATRPPVTRDLPLPVLLAGWLREQSGASTARVEIVAENERDHCGSVAARLAGTASEPALLVLGDGSNRRGPRAPGGPDERAEEFDRRVATAFATADRDALSALDADQAAQLGVSGLLPWWVLAALPTDPYRWSGQLLYSEAPFGVGYHVAVWDLL